MESSRSSPDDRHRALLLLGPTGSGKTPLGEVIQERGLWQARCLHFDFGTHLRQVVARNRPDPGVSRADIEFLRGVLRSGTLLEDKDFPIARRILQSFIARHGTQQDAWIVLNGLPRHVGQARAVDRILDVRVVVRLQCSSETVWERIRANVGGDRASRTDDDLPSVRNKLRIFSQRTAPLLEHYVRQGAFSETIDVTAGMTARQMWEMLEKTARLDDC